MSESALRDCLRAGLAAGLLAHGDVDIIHPSEQPYIVSDPQEGEIRLNGVFRVDLLLGHLEAELIKFVKAETDGK